MPRRDGQQCDNCRFYIPHDDPNVGDCHRLAPSPRPLGINVQRVEWPIVPMEEWCGEWEPITEQSRPPQLRLPTQQ